MSVPENLAALAGDWKGHNKLYLSWLPDPLHESEAAASVAPKANGQFLNLEYTWSHEGKPQQGVYLIGSDKDSNAVQAIWTDSWHMSHKFMVCDGTVDEDGKINVTGHYAVPGHPDWGWRTEIIPGDNSFRLVMYNISPEGEEEIAVEADFSRK